MMISQSVKKHSAPRTKQARYQTLGAPVEAHAKAKEKERKEKDRKLAAVASTFSSQDFEQLCERVLKACRSGAKPNEVEQHLAELRKAVLFHGLPEELKTEKKGLTIRGKVWKVLLGVDGVNGEEYMEMLSRKQCTQYVKIRGDTFRTFPQDEQFKQSVHEPELIRLLNSFVHLAAPEFNYCQGMNAISGPFLYCMSEVDAFYAFTKFIRQKFPLYWLSSHLGASAGCELVDLCLSALDKDLASHLTKHNLKAVLYAFPIISSLSSSVPPFGELMKLWDFLIAFGPHFNILCVVAQVISLRKSLLASSNPKGILDYRKWPKLKARFIISLVMSLLPKLPADLYDQMCQHATDIQVAQRLASREAYHHQPPANSTSTTNANGSGKVASSSSSAAASSSATASSLTPAASSSSAMTTISPAAFASMDLSTLSSASSASAGATPDFMNLTLDDDDDEEW